MPSKADSFLHRLFPTCHRLLLNQFLDKSFSDVRGDVLVIGAGEIDYRTLLPYASSVLLTDLQSYKYIDCVADILDLPFGDNAFDSILALEVLEHVPNLRVAAAELYRVLKPSGLCLVSIPFLFRIHGDPYDYQRLTRSGLTELFSFGFYTQVFSFGSRLHVISDLITTTHKCLCLFRPLNYLLCFLFNHSSDSPSGYFCRLTKSVE
jgi:SAM-dependent methyltransferase